MIDPVKAGLAPSPARYPWSGHRELVGRMRAALVDVEETLRLYGARRSEAMKAYAAMVRAVGREGWAVEEPGRLPWWSRVTAADKELGEPSLRPALDALGARTAPAREQASVEEVLAVVGRATGMTWERLASRVQDRATVAARELLAVVAVHRFEAKITEVGRCLGKPVDTVSRWLSRGARRRITEEAFAHQVETVAAELKPR